MKNLNCNQIKISINLKIIGEEDKNKNCIYFFLKISKNLCNLVKTLGTTTASKPNFCYIVYDMIYIPPSSSPIFLSCKF